VGKSDGRMTNTSTAILNFQRPGNPRMGSICVCRRNLVQIGQELAEIYLFVYFQDAAAAILNFTESWILTHSTPWPMFTRLPNLTQISSLATEIWRKSKSKMAEGASLNFQPMLVRSHLHSYDQYKAANQIWCKSVKNLPRYTYLCIF